jgi:hypothetical protein
MFRDNAAVLAGLQHRRSRMILATRFQLRRPNTLDRGLALPADVISARTRRAQLSPEV